MDVETLITHHLVKSEDLNHHGTLYAGRSAEWFVESGFTAAANLTKPENIVCMKIHGMTFSRPVHKGEVIKFESKVVHTGKSRIVTHVRMLSKGDAVVEGFITFVNVDLDGKPLPHGIEISPTAPVDKELKRQAQDLSI